MSNVSPESIPARANAIELRATERMLLYKQLPPDAADKLRHIGLGNAAMMKAIDEWLQRLPEDERRSFEGMLQLELAPIFAGYFQAISERALALRNGTGKQSL